MGELPLIGLCLGPTLIAVFKTNENFNGLYVVYIVVLEFLRFQEHVLQERRQQHLVAETLHRHERLHRLVNDSTAASHAELNLDC